MPNRAGAYLQEMGLVKWVGWCMARSFEAPTFFVILLPGEGDDDLDTREMGA